MEDVFSIQDEISQAIVDRLKIELLGKHGEAFGQRQTENMEAYNLYLKGRFLWHRRTEEDLLKSMKLYQQALELDSAYALAYAGLADVYFIMTWYDWDWKEAENELKLAISLNPNDANAYQYYSESMNVLGKREEARKLINQALELNPHSHIM